MIFRAFIVILSTLAAPLAEASDLYFQEVKIATRSLQAAEAFVKENGANTAPDGFSLTFTPCEGGDVICKRNQANLIVDLKFAYLGVYHAQRNLAYCLSVGCQNSVAKMPTLGCAWRIVILAAGTSSIDGSDLSNYRSCLDSLDDVERATMQHQAAALFRLIYGEALPGQWR